MSKKPTYEELEQRNKELEKEAYKRRQAEEAFQQRTHDLGERVKELNCLYGLTEIIERPNVSLKDIYQGTVDIIPASWQYPEITCARIVINGKEYTNKNFKETKWKQSCDINIGGKKVGILDVFYLKEMSIITDEGPFLEEERKLINALAEGLGKVTDHIQADEELSLIHI